MAGVYGRPQSGFRIGGRGAISVYIAFKSPISSIICSCVVQLAVSNIVF
jgi:hypothetical protein